MFGISGTELFVIVAFVLLIFGPDKLPQIGRTVGQVMREFKRAQESMEAVIRAEVYAKNSAATDTGSSDSESSPDVSESVSAAAVEDDDEDEDEEEEETTR